MSGNVTLPADFVLLVNARDDKGYGFLIDVAVACPRIPFVAIASQTELDGAVLAARSRRAANVTVIGRTDDMDALYRAARVVAVPSYRFIETFSRVCIEAHRFGRPVLGSNTGNVPYLLERPGIVLPQEVDRWAAELRRLYEDQAYYAERSAAALENSQRYSYRAQRQSILDIVSAAQEPFLLAVGSGIGNMTHVSPLVRRIAEHLGRRIDIVVGEDHQNSLSLLQNPRWVNASYSLKRDVLSRRYDTVFVTHCFGATPVPFRARRVVWSRDWDEFHAGHALHEARFNLEAAKQLLGIDYDEADVRNYYVSDIDYVWPNGKLVGFHGGSKTGFWASKRWPHYADLAEVLKRRGYRVASFGTVEEYVENTEDFTGGSIEEMARRMRECSYFVGNDSGVMHVANSLGIPLLALFGPTNPATRGPLRYSSRTLALAKSCAPCECLDKARFESGDCRCIGEISLEDALGAFEAMVADPWRGGVSGSFEPKGVGRDSGSGFRRRAARQDLDPAHQARTAP